MILPHVKDLICIDLETYDPNLKAKGPGTFRGDGHVAGVAIKEYMKQPIYLPIGHTNGNIDKEAAKSIIKDKLMNDRPKLGARLLYDLEWLHWLGIDNIPGLKVDVQVIEPLIDENQYHYNLENLGKKYVGEGKLKGTLVDACRENGFKVTADSDVFKHLYKLHPTQVEPYVFRDLDLPFHIYAKQRNILIDEGLESVVMLELKLTDLLLKMRIQGVPIDIDKAEQVNKRLIDEEKKLTRKLANVSGGEIDIYAATSIAVAFDAAGISYPRTPKTNSPSFTAPWLESHPSELAKTLVALRKITKMRKDFVEGLVLGSSIKGRIHAQFHQVKHEEGGTVTGRFSSSNPNLQQVPARDPVYAPLVRGMFVPDKGYMWCKGDYSQQEPRLTVHYAAMKKFKGSEIAVAKYTEDVSTDYHQMVADLCGIERRPAKDINLGLAYGMGVNLMAERLGKSIAETKELFAKYHAGVPYVKLLSESCMNVATTRGYIKTLLGRRRHFNLWSAPTKYDKNNPKPSLPYDEAVAAYGLPLRRAFTYKALNALIQGSAADMVKQAMLNMYETGYIPYLTVHDETDTKVENKKQATEIKDIMVNAVKLLVPLKVDMFVKKNWGDCHD